MHFCSILEAIVVITILAFYDYEPKSQLKFKFNQLKIKGEENMAKKVMKINKLNQAAQVK